MSSLTQETPQAQGRERTTPLPSLLRILSIFQRLTAQLFEKFFSQCTFSDRKDGDLFIYLSCSFT